MTTVIIIFFGLLGMVVLIGIFRFAYTHHKLDHISKDEQIFLKHIFDSKLKEESPKS